MTPVPNADPILTIQPIQKFINEFWIKHSFNGKIELSEPEFKKYSEILIKLFESVK